MRQLTKNDVRIALIVSEEDIPVRGNAMASGDADFDRRVENSILRDLERGNEWAWCSVEVRVSHPDFPDCTASDYLGCCSYKNSRDFIKNSGYYDDMVDNALAELNDRIDREAREALAGITGRAARLAALLCD